MNVYYNHVKRISGLSGYQELDAWRQDSRRVFSRVDHYFGADLRVFTTTLIPSEILLSFEIASLDSEEVAPIIESMGMSERDKCLEASSNIGLGLDVCPYPLITIGAFERGLLPAPDAFIGSSYMCNDQFEMIKLLANRHQKPRFIFDIPFWHDACSHETQRYVVSQMKNFISFLENITGKRFDFDHFVEVTNRSSNTYQTLDRIKAERKGNLNVSGSDFPYLYGSQVLFGDRQNQKMYETLLEELVSRRVNDRGKLRALWINVIPLRKKRLIKEIEKEFGIDIVYDEISSCNASDLQTDASLLSFANKYLSGTYLNGVKRRKKRLSKIIKEYHIDIAFGFSYAKCKSTSGSVGELREVFDAEGIPYQEWVVESISGSEISDDRIRTDIRNLVQIATNSNPV
ncbi:MAG: 2-hydroxyacyl-CoA dehydratase family protein [Clostridiales bacterium]|jgi:benzoyl-CoA reductase/2-hydroxyglutaryl-CoA dehydratase subunit BcrC/BadD/HgdB|nr:2-hydroxyacyl-CoA dehydratase family protein [Clostridiales bacterium]